MVLVWMAGDCGKTAYFIYENSPAQFWLCGIIQVSYDFFLFFKYFNYKYSFIKS